MLVSKVRNGRLSLHKHGSETKNSDLELRSREGSPAAAKLTFVHPRE